MEENNAYLHRQLVKLGDMMGDGLHHEADGKWIEKEYAKICKVLHPEMFLKQNEAKKKARKLKAIAVNDRMDEILKDFKCKCGGTLKQGRSGTKVANCILCENRYKLGSKKK